MSQRKSYLVTGATGQVALPIAERLAADADVWATARFSDPALRERLERAGVRCVVADLVDGDLGELPERVDHILNFAVMKTNDWGRDLDGNAGGTGKLMGRFRDATSFLHCSSTAVYQPDGQHQFAEDDPLGDNHRVWSFIETYSISKIAAEAMARFCAREYGLPTTIARLNVPYGDNGGWPDNHVDLIAAGIPIPVYVEGPTNYNPIHEDDLVAMIPALLDAASVPATVVNWGGDEVVSIEEWGAFLADLMGAEAKFDPTTEHISSVSVDLTRMHEIAGHTTVSWRDGFRRMMEARHPEKLRAGA